jgi:hypothetical protein
MPTPPPKQATSMLGQIRDDVMEAGKDLAADTAKAVVSEPKKILESILGKSDDGGEDPGIEDMSGGSQDPKAMAAKQQLMAKKQADDQQKSAQLLQLHRQRLQEEEAYHSQKKQEEELEEKQEEKQEEEEKKQQIFQLQHERSKENVLGSVIGQREGSKEKKAWGAG